MRVRLTLTVLVAAAVSMSAGGGEPYPRAVPEASPAAVEPLPVADAPWSDAPWSDAWLLSFTDAYLHDGEARRAAVLQSLRNPDNLYGKLRVASYARVDTGWDALPTWNPRTVVLTDAELETLQARGTVRLPDDAAPLWDGETPDTMAQWVALGRRVFFTYPLRPEAAAAHALAVARADAIGLRRDPAAGDGGVVPGVVAFADVDGDTKVGITCALCHTALEDGALVVGRARRELDYGAMRLAWHRDLGDAIDPRLAARLASWGPGRADITEDDDADPVAIPDLWRLRSLRALTQAATIVHDRRDGSATPLVLAIRQETQYIHANGERTRPPRELAWALAMFLYSLDAPPIADAAISAGAGDDARIARGRAVFEAHCLDCHGDEARSGVPVSARRVGTDPALANGTSRGTGLYRPAPLVGVTAAAPYLHDGSVATLDDLFDRARLQPGFARGARGPGAVPGHAYGTKLSAHDRDALVAWLRTQ
ncbi:MAG: c-type cytochrome [Deltaproteobacteria bacterium]|nr:c-type cytochrome [Deltaproteobacteria bacterium]MBK8716052.1 c-type cytochrome [Deltaproteobacteria bacterium]MBP7286874.1 c-type cytochrome [Nannocystaceae bacterium]